MIMKHVEWTLYLFIVYSPFFFSQAQTNPGNCDKLMEFASDKDAYTYVSTRQMLISAM